MRRLFVLFVFPILILFCVSFVWRSVTLGKFDEVKRSVNSDVIGRYQMSAVSGDSVFIMDTINSKLYRMELTREFYDEEIALPNGRKESIRRMKKEWKVQVISIDFAKVTKQSQKGKEER